MLLLILNDNKKYMADIIKKENVSATKKDSRADIEKRLETALASFKDVLGEKKFTRRIKKAAKAFAHGMQKATAKPSVKTKKNVALPKAKKSPAKKAKAAKQAKASK